MPAGFNFGYMVAWGQVRKQLSKSVSALALVARVILLLTHYLTHSLTYSFTNSLTYWCQASVVDKFVPGLGGKTDPVGPSPVMIHVEQLKQVGWLSPQARIRVRLRVRARPRAR